MEDGKPQLMNCELGKFLGYVFTIEMFINTMENHF